MKVLVLCSLLLAAACHPAPPPARPPTSAPVDFGASQVQSCTTAPSVRVADVCPNEFTDDGLACVTCGVEQGCVDAVDEVYCVAHGCALDTRCSIHPDVTPFESRRVSRRHSGQPP